MLSPSSKLVLYRRFVTRIAAFCLFPTAMVCAGKLRAEDASPGVPRSAAAVKPGEGTPNPAKTVPPAEAQVAASTARENLLGLFRTYEPTQIGWTKDQGDDGFMDFTLSTMFPVLHGYFPDRPGYQPGILADLLSWWRYARPYPYLAATIRDGFYLGSRPSSPVVGKRYNPAFLLRWWSFDSRASGQSLHRYVEVGYAHESNGQTIANPTSFADQEKIYLHGEIQQADPTALHRAYLGARDAISRGWDYWGVHVAGEYRLGQSRVTALARFDYYLRHGLLQGPAEEYNSWEMDSQGKRRRLVDGLSLRATLQTAAYRPARWFQFDGRFALTVTTGTQTPGRYLTEKIEAGARIVNLPIFFWFRHGYNSDLIDYYHKDDSWGVALSFWDF